MGLDTQTQAQCIQASAEERVIAKIIPTKTAFSRPAHVSGKSKSRAVPHVVAATRRDPSPAHGRTGYSAEDAEWNHGATEATKVTQPPPACLPACHACPPRGPFLRGPLARPKPAVELVEWHISPRPGRYEPPERHCHSGKRLRWVYTSLSMRCTLPGSIESLELSKCVSLLKQS